MHDHNCNYCTCAVITASRGLRPIWRVRQLAAPLSCERCQLEVTLIYKVIWHCLIKPFTFYNWTQIFITNYNLFHKLFPIRDIELEAADEPGAADYSWRTPTPPGWRATPRRKMTTSRRLLLTSARRPIIIQPYVYIASESVRCPLKSKLKLGPESI